MTAQVIFDPLLPWPVLWVAAVLALAAALLSAWRGLAGWPYRALAAIVLLAGLAQPSLQNENRQALSDIVVAIVDDTASQQLGDRPAQTEAAVEGLKAEVAALPATELRIVRLGDAPENAGTLLMQRLAEALAAEPRDRLAGAVLISDGRAHDLARAPDLPAPLNLLLTGHAADWDRRLVVQKAPGFAILGEPLTLTLRVEDQGAVPAGLPALAQIGISIDGAAPEPHAVPVGQPVELSLDLPHGGMNVVQLTLEGQPGELTDRNNSAIVQVNAVRDRLRVLLVSGEPHAGERTWRNLLKSDASVDLVHFTILRPPEKQDGVPVSELSLIAFPTRELFLDKIRDFDLIIFDRYRMRDILPASYLENVRKYVEEGGAVLVSAGPEFASADSLAHSPLGAILPAEPTARVIDKPFLPRLTDLGRRHPVTEGLEAFAPRAATAEGPGWGRWFRQVEVRPTAGVTVMQGAEDQPLLQLGRVGKGRIALLASDQAWLWSRGYEGGGPQLELLRRLAHWMMKEPDLEEEALTATATGQEMVVTRRSLGETVPEVTVTGPDGMAQALPLAAAGPGLWQARLHGAAPGLYRLAQGDVSAVVALGPPAPREFEEPIASAEALAPLLEAHRGGVVRLEAGMPALRRVKAGRPAAGRGWIGITPRGASVTTDLRLVPLVWPWAFLLAAAILALAGWLREARR
jgi:hypothetical protein